MSSYNKDDQYPWLFIFRERVRREEETGISDSIQQSENIMSHSHTFKVSHERLRTRVERIDDHLAVCRACDFDPAVFKAGRGRGAYP